MNGSLKILLSILAGSIIGIILALIKISAALGAYGVQIDTATQKAEHSEASINEIRGQLNDINVSLQKIKIQCGHSKENNKDAAR